MLGIDGVGAPPPALDFGLSGRNRWCRPQAAEMTSGYVAPGMPLPEADAAA